jgi:hypothetical protein
MYLFDTFEHSAAVFGNFRTCIYSTLLSIPLLFLVICIACIYLILLNIPLLFLVISVPCIYLTLLNIPLLFLVIKLYAVLSRKQ